LLDTAGLAILHGCLAALLVEALLRIWRVQAPGERLALRWLALVAPIILPAAFALFAPARSSERFSSSQALFAGEHWNQMTLGHAGVARIATVALVIAGGLLYLRDALPFLADRFRGIRDLDSVSSHPGLARVRGQIDTLRRLVGGPQVTVVLLDRATPVLLCTGIDRPAVIVSTGALDRLDDDELRAALAHELAHAARRDPLAGWLLMVVRTAACFSPAAQIVARQVVQELEYRADMAVARLGYSAALSRAIAALSDMPGADTDLVPLRAGLGLPLDMLARAERAAVDTRCERVFVQPMAATPGVGVFRLGLAAVGLTALLFFVV
jgi:Zn-dependent protease with chaperone function